MPSDEDNEPPRWGKIVTNLSHLVALPVLWLAYRQNDMLVFWLGLSYLAQELLFLLIHSGLLRPSKRMKILLILPAILTYALVYIRCLALLVDSYAKPLTTRISLIVALITIHVLGDMLYWDNQHKHEWENKHHTIKHAMAWAALCLVTTMPGDPKLSTIYAPFLKDH